MVSGVDLFFSLFNNLTIFVATVAVYGFLYARLRDSNKYLRQMLFGLCFGVIAIGCMYAKIPVYEGVVVDQRNAIVAISGAFGGPFSALVSLIIAGSFRIYLGGGGVISGLTGLTLAALSGSILNRIPKSFRTISGSALSALGATLFINLGWLAFKDIKTGWPTLQRVIPPFAGAIFLGIFIVGILIKWEERRQHIELEFRESEEKYRVLFEFFPLGLLISDKAGNILEINRTADKILDEQKVKPTLRKIGSEGLSFLKPDGSAMLPEEFASVRALQENRQINNDEMGIVRRDDQKTWLSVTAAPIPLEKYGVAVAYNDITDRVRAETRLKDALHEKTVLLQELYHRTNNNMQVIISLINSQSSYVDDPEMNEFFQKTKNRIHSMALVHEKLYQSEDLSHLNLADYIRELAEWLVQAYETEPNTVDLEFDMEEVIVLIDTAIPCGLIIEELLSNALKHAFPDRRKGTIAIHLRREPSGELILQVCDNGIGFRDGFDFRTDGHIGIQTILALSEGQLNGDVILTGKNGVTFRLRFRDNLYSARV